MVGQGHVRESRVLLLFITYTKTFMEPIFSVTSTGLIVTIEGISYLMEWINSMLKVSGPDLCYYILETARGIEQADCTMQTFELLIPNE